MKDIFPVILQRCIDLQTSIKNKQAPARHAVLTIPQGALSLTEYYAEEKPEMTLIELKKQSPKKYKYVLYTLSL